MRPWLIVVLVICFLAEAASAQTIHATLTGTVTDQTGSIIPNARVVATHEETRIQYASSSNDFGVYNLSFLPHGAYVVTVEAPGFRTTVTNSIKLEVNQIAGLDLRLEVGPLTQQVAVQDVAPILQTESVTVGDVISATTTVNMPLNGRNFQQLTLLVPGSVNPDPNQFASVGAQGRPFVNGNREQGNNFLLDGISIDETIDNRIGYHPNIDAIAEFRIETNNSSAEFGNVTGAVVIAATKSGTNEFRGSLFEFFRNEALDANSWSNNRNSSPQSRIGRSKFRQSIWGGTLGGPVVSNKVFFFSAYQDTRQRRGGPTAATVAPEEWRRGDFSGVPVAILDPRTGRPFAGNQIPLDRFSRTARALFADPQLYPLATRPGTTDINGNYATSTLSALTAYQIDGKIDAKLTGKDAFYARYSLGNSDDDSIRGGLPSNITTSRRSRPQNTVLNWNRTFSASVINESRIGLNRAVFISEPFDWAGLGKANTRLGIPGNQIIDGLSSIGGIGIGNVAQIEDNVTNTFHYGDLLSISSGKHLMKVGAQWQRYQQNRFYSGNNGVLGLFDYDGTFTGHPFSDFLLDQLRRKGIGSLTGTWGHRQNRIGVFFQDDFKLRRNWTLNLGMRWEYTSPLVEVKDRQSNFDITTGRQLFAGKDGNSRALYKPYFKGFEPIIGFAWTPEKLNDKFVVRAGYRITQFMEGTGSNLRLPLNPPLFFEADKTFDRSTGPGTISTGFSDVIARDEVSGVIRIWSPDLRPQFTQQWNFTLEYRLNDSTSISAGYVAHKATHLVNPVDWNQPLPGTGDPNTWAPLQERRPLYRVRPLVTQVSGTDSSSTSDYHSLQIRARKRMTRGFEFLGSYTLSKSLTDNLGYYGCGAAGSPFWINAYDRRGDRGLSCFDAAHNFVWSGTYELPLGRQKGTWDPLANALLGGWNISSIVTLRSGIPLTVEQGGTPTSSSLQDSRGGERPDRVAGRSGKVKDPSPERWLDIAAYTFHPLGAFGNAGNGSERGPGFANWDLGVAKSFNVSDSKSIHFRAEFFNFTNHPSYGHPSRNISDPVNFGRIFGTVSTPRNIQFATKVLF